ncbi:LiaG family protein [Bacillus changyiensis]|uniref:LiaG family protein n=1 Tax=Bacillus changyiensis TaxID=3004103 RepID=UPI0022E2CEE8|nr:DUF4097 domain-containing protein [Bacillus changyiensis]MDA1476379.1 DUF4097 domain-containing protein [Bacillus changyiensis]
MKKTVGKMLIIVGILIIASLTFGGGRISSLFTANQESDQSAHALASKMNHIDINGQNMTVKIKAENRDNIEAVLSGESVHLKSSEQGGTFRLSVQPKGSLLFSFRKNELIVKVPYQFQHDLSIKSDSGNVNISGEHLSLRHVSVKSGAGNLKINQLHSSELSVKGNSGNIRLENVETRTAKIDSTSGNTKLDHVSGKLNIKQNLGNLNASFSTINAPLSIDGNIGNTKLELPEDADISLDAKATIGNIKHSYSFDETSGDKQKLIGKNRSGRYKISISLTSGNLSIE